MPAFFQSAFLRSLGYAITNSLWQMAIIWVVFMLINSVFRLTAAAKYRAAVAAQFIGFSWFLVTLWFYYTQYNTTAVTITTGFTAVEGSYTGQLVNLLLKTEQMLPYLSMAYLLLMLFLGVRWILGYRNTQIIRASGLEKMPVNWRMFVKKVSAQLGIKKEIRLFLSQYVTSPLTIGFLKPIILIPVAGINHLTTEQLEAILLHELAHIKRYDYLLNMILSVVELALFFNPFTQLLSTTIQKERENSCDDWVLQFQYDASEYAAALLRIAYLQNTPAFAMAASGTKNELLTRVKRMIGQKENPFSYRKRLLAFVLVTGLLSSIAWLSPASSAIHPNKANIAAVTALKKNLVLQPVLTKTVVPAQAKENPLFNPAFFLPEKMKVAIRKDLERAAKEIEETQEDKEMALMQSVPNIVSGAFKDAREEIMKKRSGLTAEIDAINFAKAALEKTLGKDSVSLPKKLRMSFGDGVAGSLKEMTKELGKAKLELAAIPGIKEIPMPVIDENEISLQLGNAYHELQKIDLEKLVHDVMRFGEQNDDEKKGLKRMKRIRLSDKDKELLQKELKDKQEMRLRTSNEQVAGEVAMLSPDEAPAVTVSTVAMPVIRLSKEDALRVVKIKLAILQQLRLATNIEIRPVVFKEKKKQKEEKEEIIVDQQ